MKDLDLNSLCIAPITNKPGQSGIFAKRKFDANQTVLYLSGEVLHRPTRTSIQVAKNKHIEDKIGAFINHNCNPSCKIDGHKVIAIKEINVDDEVTFDYSDNETVMAGPFICSCCNKLISGSLPN